ncbi:MAG TPA: hypothetical protein VFA07_10075 [Chthonomonadaceae bacterium]|nr:hypothetical protein [Chthonomonadaceae bacterium]
MAFRAYTITGFFGLLLACIVPLPAAAQASTGMTVKLHADRSVVGMGRSVIVTATVTGNNDVPVSGVQLWPYLNGKQWGASETTDRTGRAIFFLPLPYPGTARIEAIIGPSGSGQKETFPVGSPQPKDGIRSNEVQVRVKSRTIRRVIRDPEHLVGVEWEPWFTPLNAHWDTAEAIPVLGRYNSFNADVIRQHALWMTEAGIDFLLVDWSNNLWGKQHWSERAPGVDELIRATTLLLDTYAQMRGEGIPVPQITLLLGLDNGPQTTTTALNEEMQWIYEHYVTNPRYRDLWVWYEGKPLIVPFNGGGPNVLKGQPPLDESKFTVRWMASQLQADHFDRDGYWSWMDGSLQPITTYSGGMPEALTITPAFFGDGGWTYPQALGRRGGATYLQQWETASTQRPHFLLINQWNEFAGQPNGGGYGPKKDQYVDCYSADLSNDIEPTSPTACAYRGCGGWGFTYLNLTRALIALYHQPSPGSTLLTVSEPQPSATVSGPTLSVRWTVAGKPVRSFSLKVDGRTVARSVTGNAAILDMSRFASGRHILTVLAEGARSRFPLSPIREDDDLPTLQPVSAQVAFFKK